MLNNILWNQIVKLSIIFIFILLPTGQNTESTSNNNTTDAFSMTILKKPKAGEKFLEGNHYSCNQCTGINNVLSFL